MKADIQLSYLQVANIQLQMQNPLPLFAKQQMQQQMVMLRQRQQMLQQQLQKPVDSELEQEEMLEMHKSSLANRQVHTYHLQ